MNRKKLFLTLVFIALVAVLAAGVVFAADDGPLFTRNLSRTPETEVGGAQISVMQLYVPAQAASGELLEGIDYVAGDCTNEDPTGCAVVTTLYDAKPLISTYEDGLVHVEEIVREGEVIQTGTGFGDRDAFASLSLDDGATWKDTNLSTSAHKSSFTLKNGTAYPGDVFRINHVVAGNRVAVAWISRFCQEGAPLYSWSDDEKDALLAAYPHLDNPVSVDGVDEPYQMYMDDMFTVAGEQKSVDYTLQGFPEVGEIPYGCVWVARGTLEQDDETGLYDITWRQAERLTSGRRDANRVDITGTGGAGFIISWQEDPEGLRPGKGLGPGEGWSGAIANAKTDIWYTHISWDDFDDVCLDDGDVYCDTGELSEFTLETKPKAAVPFAVPLRLTDNNMCKANQQYIDGVLLDPYCYADFNDTTVDGLDAADLCADTYDWVNPMGVSIPVCVAEDGRVMDGRTASTRVRWAIKPYDQDGDGTNDSGWVILAEEKMKALGTSMVNPDDPTQDCTANPTDCVIVDIGKNMWYHTFEFNNPEIVQQGLILNSPAISPETLDYFDVNVDDQGFEYYDFEISRRFNLMVQGIGAAMASESKTSAFLIYKEGILNQGGPADIFTRRVVLPDDFDPTVDNPFAYENVVCDAFEGEITLEEGEWLYTDGSNPNYLRGLCMIQGMNVSGTSIISCDDGSGGETCADQFPFDLTYEEWLGEDIELPKVTEWRQCDGETSIEGCVTDISNFADPSWANPYDVSKGHRGFIDGDFIMLMYATAPNWKANTIGNEAYNLYIRRSFDGGQTWTTLPATFNHIDGIAYSGLGTTTCEDYGWGGQVEEETCFDYGPGDFEQARNVSRIVGSRRTVLDPRYSPTGGMLKLDYDDLLCDDDSDGVWENCEYAESPNLFEIRDPSAYFVTYEYGDNTVVTEETGAVPMDMYYSRAFNFGDEYDEVETIIGYDADLNPVTEFRWDWLENGDDISSEASVYASADGSKFYSVWNQELEIAPEVYTNIDVMFRRIFYNLTNTDVYPSSAILYVSADWISLDEISEDEMLLLIGSAWDNDLIDGLPYEDIDEVVWLLDGVEVDDGDDDPFRLNYQVNCDNCTFPGLHPGWHNFTFKASDKGGKWSPGSSVDVFVTEHTFRNFIPTFTLSLFE